MGVLLIPVLGLATALGVLGLAVSGVANVVIGIHRRLNSRPCLRSLAKGGVELLLAGLLVWVPFVAVHRAESRNDWVDEDHDGMFDGMANGEYDWLDVVGGDFGRTWAALAVVIVTPAGLALHALHEKDAGQACHPGQRGGP